MADQEAHASGTILLSASTAKGRKSALMVAVLLIFPLFVSSLIGYAYQALRDVPVFGTSGGMESFVEAVEAGTAEVEQLAETCWRDRLQLGRVELADNSARALERYALLQARDLMRAHLGAGEVLPDEVTYLATKGRLRLLCTAALAADTASPGWSLPTDPQQRAELVRQCQPEPVRTAYRDWLRSGGAGELLAPGLQSGVGNLRGRDLGDTD